MRRELSPIADVEHLHAPVGLDIGANNPAEIALAIIAEMRAVLDDRRGGMLRDRDGSIHGDREERLVPMWNASMMSLDGEDARDNPSRLRE